MYPTTVTNISCSQDVVQFLKSDDDACEILDAIEDTFGCEVSITSNALAITHPESTDIVDIEEALLQKYYSHHFSKSMEYSLFWQAYPHSKKMQIPASRVSMITAVRRRLCRQTALAHIAVTPAGLLTLFGTAESASHARILIRNLLHAGGVPAPPNGDLFTHDESPASADEDSAFYPSNGHGHPHFMHRPPPTHPQHKPDFSMPPPSHMAHHQHPDMNNNMMAARRRERLTFNVRSSDAPRLIGTRGVNKKRIEESTNCSIILHTESKKDGEFPVEVVAMSMRHCEAARTHIETFLACAGHDDEERKSNKERPKVHLAFSPRKNRKPDEELQKPPTRD